MIVSLMTALGLVIVIEGILPFAAPRLWRDTMERLGKLADGQIRMFGLALMVVGLLVMYIFTK